MIYTYCRNTNRKNSHSISFNEGIEMFDKIMYEKIIALYEENIEIDNIFNSINALTESFIITEAEAENQKKNIFRRIFDGIIKAAKWLKGKIVEFINKIRAKFSAKRKILNDFEDFFEEDDIVEIELSEEQKSNVIEKLQDNMETAVEKIQELETEKENNNDGEKKLDIIKLSGQISNCFEVNYNYNISDISEIIENSIETIDTIIEENKKLDDPNSIADDFKDSSFGRNIIGTIESAINKLECHFSTRQYSSNTFVTHDYAETIIDKCKKLENAISNLNVYIDNLQKVNLTSIIEKAEKSLQYYEDEVNKSATKYGENSAVTNIEKVHAKLAKLQVQGYKTVYEYVSIALNTYNRLITPFNLLYDVYLHNLNIVKSCYKKSE